MNFSLFLPIVLHISVFFIMQLVYNFVQETKLTKGRLYRENPNSKVLKVKEVSSFIDGLMGGSSVWCTGYNKTDRICKFRNLCYHPIYKEYIFFHGDKTVLDGIPQDRFSPALLDMSSIDDHNTQYFNFIDFPTSSLLNSFTNITVYDGVSFIFHRFNSENIMHVFHDDLLPLFHTMKQYTNGKTIEPLDLNSRVVFMEGWEQGPYFELYKLFSHSKPLLKQDIIKNNRLKCFQLAIVGISKFTTWYQYGFKIPQGPLPRIQITGGQMREFTSFIKERMGIYEPTDNTDVDYIVFFLRQHNRLIINEADITIAMAKKFNKRVVQVSMETHSLKQLIRIISKASALVGMHGSALVMSMFLPLGGVIVEMFPYAINPENYQPYKTLATLPGMNLIYTSWRNTIPENSVTHPYDPSEIGGIMHLSKEEQELITSTTEVPPHLCCSNSFWLYRIYQDTLVDKDSFLEVMGDAFHTRGELIAKGFSSKHNQRLHPSKVINVTCTGSSGTNGSNKPSLFVSWKKPINVKYFDTNIKYEVWIQKAENDDYMPYLLPFTEYLFTDGLEVNTHYRVWVRCIAGNVLGPFGVMTSCYT
ncbi:protein O-linked-mannose beta-1,4-N-acetylglucosaminyltransferase 2-like [Actinia tenebrosa]|uniref:Protein O-linked-mannose beta-1,4-N-acetylglucosaminyltransferase 2 n=1 Tax=Actinia tenebrosa TaxID=6105 RepID=A0A6P8ITV6_ACTTE|nr:protein O-linked-mannose beta-1,4-N-acetylglucosaminyltransferase 2-like [Actinia tenebrosa]